MLMSTIDEYLATVAPAERTEFERIRGIVRRIVPDVVEGKCYGIPAYLYSGKPFLAAVANKRFLSIYPFSGKIIDTLRDELASFECTSGSIHFSANHPIPTDLLEKIIAARLREIGSATSRK